MDENGGDKAIYLQGSVFVLMILVTRHLFYRNYVGLCLWPFIILREESLREDPVLINHERIHLRQQAELLVVFFYIAYLLEWVIKSAYYLDCYRGYKNISFEREAYLYEKDCQYLENRRPLQFLQYVFHRPAFS
jgi:hypothetical protein